MNGQRITHELNGLKLSTEPSTDIFVGRVTSRYISDVSCLCLSHGAA